MFKYNEELVALASAHRAIVDEDYKKSYEAVGHSDVVYKGKQLPYLYFPAVYSEEDVLRFETMTKRIFDIVNKSIDIYFNHPEVRRVWGFDPRLEELVLLPHRFKAKVPMGRFDFFYYEDGSYKFCELNTDGTSAMNEEMPLTDVLINTYVLNKFKENHQVKRYELYQSWVDEVKSIYEEYVQNGGERSKKPHLIIMDYMSKGSPHEFEAFKKCFNANGFRCQIVSPDELTEVEGTLYYNREKVDIIYRRLVTRDLMEHYDDLMPLINGIKANKTCIIGSIKSQIVHTKKYFEALHHPLVRKYFSKEDLDYIDAHIPYTSALNKADSFEKFIEHKDQYIIKPIDFYASKGVYAGKEYDRKTWSEMLEKASDEGYIIQEFCPKSVNRNLDFSGNDTFEVADYNNITGVFVYNEKMKGIFTRAGFNAVISDLNDGFSLSSIVASAI
ncbi:glutathionylspermidine synthase family protein [Fusibacter sp. 3D3]|uniref:glutathionylspermidine synthase family protein n=1 Tax=Fusibacter sp. 3D3 TaxID=1048380 RepID=UPI0008534671|nr:glutathionylspermidine synthase family protein [Fusibacter sp. 3D3]GAU79947.1 OrfE protein [Fusibacter sp. 3D3]